MKKWILLLILLLVVTGIAQAIPDPSAWYCTLQGYDLEIRTDEQGNQYGVCVFPDGSECGTWAYYCTCEPNGIGCWLGDFNCHWPCEEMRCKEAGEPVLVSTCCEGLDEIYPANIFDANCNNLGMVGWLFLCSDCGNGFCESWESRCNCPEDCAQPCIFYVDADANGLNDGSSWADAYNNLQDALAVALPGDEIRVAQGIYKPNPLPPEKASNPSPADGSTYVSMTADLSWTAGAGAVSHDVYFGTTSPGMFQGNQTNTTFDPGTTASGIKYYWRIDEVGSWSTSTGVVWSFTTISGPPPLALSPLGADSAEDTTISPHSRLATFQLKNGVIIKGGYAGFGEPDPDARDIEVYESILSGDLDGNDVELSDPRDLLDEPTRAENSYHVVTGSGTDTTTILDGFTITGGNANSHWYYGHNSGGGMYNDSGNPKVINCTFKGNSAEYGGGLDNGNSPTLNNCIFSGNLAEHGGGGMYNEDCDPPLFNCTFIGNCASDGGGMFNISSSPVLTNCTFRNNSGYKGGGISNFGSSPMVMNCMFGGNSAVWGGGIYNYESNLMMTNCIVSGNRARWSGGGMCLWTGIPSPGGPCYVKQTCNVTLINCTFTENQAEAGKALTCDSCNNQFPSEVQIANCILWDGGDEILNYDNSTIMITYSDIWDGFAGEGNIDSVPLFIEPGYWALRDDPNIVVEPNDPNAIWVEGDYHLLPDSPCIDAGDPNYTAEPNETDLEGNPRVVNGRIDMGAYEYIPPVPAEVDIDPNTLNLKSKGKWITAFIWLPEGYDVDDIEPNSVYLEGDIEPERFWVAEDQQVAIAKFNRQEVQSILDIGEVELTINGNFIDGITFEATDTIKVIDKGKEKKK